MSKRDPGNPPAVLETTAGSQIIALSSNSGKQDSMTPHDLLKINVNDHTEKKQKLTYLSWAWAWTEALKADPTATFEVKTFKHDEYTELPYMDVNGTGMVWVTVTMLGMSRTCMLPVMDHMNKPIVKPNAFQVNTAIMRCMTKTLGLFGLGLYIYAGEDLPMDEEPEKPEVKVVKRKEVPPGELPKKEDMRLFADSMIEYTKVCESVAHLNSYWKSNQSQLEILNSVYPDMYEEVLTKFKQLKESFKEKSNE